MNRKVIFLSVIVAVIGGGIIASQNCGPRYNGGFNAITSSIPGQAQSGGYVQIERLARPGINEALVVSNANLIAFNSIPPTLDLATDNPAVLAVLKEAAGTLGVVDSLDSKA